MSTEGPPSDCDDFTLPPNGWAVFGQVCFAVIITAILILTGVGIANHFTRIRHIEEDAILQRVKTEQDIAFEYLKRKELESKVEALETQLTRNNYEGRWGAQDKYDMYQTGRIIKLEGKILELEQRR